jgi:chemotaxis protein methyltransferase CheR
MSPLLSDTEELTRCKELLQNVCGFKFGQERENFLQAALNKRMLKKGIDTLKTYNGMLAHNIDEFQCLVELLTVNETYFMREPEHLKLLIERLVPELLAEAGTRRIKIVSAGCSSGAEPYSVAILLRERFGAKSEGLFSITGADIDASVINHARQGVYGKGFFRGVDPVLVDRYFTTGDFGEMRLKDEIRRAVTFEVINLLDGLFPPAMQHADLILYRNVSIYFPEQVQRVIFGKLADLLVDGGYLIVGASETIHHDVGILSLVERDGLFVYQKLPGFTVKERRGSRRDDKPTVQAEVRASISAISTPWKRPVTRLPDSGTTAAAKKVLSSRAATAGIDIKSTFDEALQMAVDGRVDEALAKLEIVMGLDTTFVKAHTLAASIHLNSAHYEKARSAAEASLVCDPLCSEATLMLGIIERHEGNRDAAYIRFREAKYLNPGCWLAYIHLGEIDFAREERQRARSSYAAALSLLENGSLEERGRDFFPLTINAEQFLVLCRHKMTLLQKRES